MKATAQRASKQRAKSPIQTTRQTKKTVARRKRGSNHRGSPRTAARYPVAETLRWVAEGEILLVKWGAIKSPGAQRIAGTVAKVLGVLEALMELRKN